MATKLILDTEAMQEDFFSDTALIGIGSATPGYHFAWLVNKYFDLNFRRKPDFDICLNESPETKNYFTIYEYSLPLNGSRYLLYKLKSGEFSLLPEVKQLDYLWMIQSTEAEKDSQNIVSRLRDIPEIQLARFLDIERIKNISYLLV